MQSKCVLVDEKNIPIAETRFETYLKKLKEEK